jgi:vacuolar-type H+-ATPase subunit C/Vma6
MSIRSVSAYSLVQATVRAMYSTMLMPETWMALIQADDFDAVLNILSRTVYGPYVQLDRRVLTPRRAVYQVRCHLAAAYDKLIQLTPEPGRALLAQVWRGYEVDNLKATLRGVERGESWAHVRYLLAPLTGVALLKASDIERMLESGSVARAVERIRHTPYYEALSHALDRYQQEGSLFPLEVALDLEHRRALWRMIQGLEGVDRAHALRLLGTMVDADNLLWAIRYRVYHHLSEQEIINYTLPFGYEVHDQDIRAIARGGEIEPVLERAYRNVDGLAQISFLDARAGLQKLERALAELLVKRCRATFVGEPFHVGLPIAYLLLSEQETRNLTSVIEAKASRLSREALEAMLVV